MRNSASREGVILRAAWCHRLRARGEPLAFSENGLQTVRQENKPGEAFSDRVVHSPKALDKDGLKRYIY